MTPGRPCPWETAKRLMHDASEFARMERHAPSFTLTADGQAFVVEGFTVELSQIKSGYRAALALATSLVDDLLADHDSQIPVNMNWVDNMPRDTPDYGFLSPPAIQELRMRGLIAKMSPENRPRWFLPFKDGETPRWNPAAVSTFATKADAIMELLSILIFISGGQMSRGSEFVLLTYRNLPNALRSLFMTNDGLISILAYSKVCFPFFPPSIISVLNFILMFALSRSIAWSERNTSFLVFQKVPQHTFWSECSCSRGFKKRSSTPPSTLTQGLSAQMLYDTSFLPVTGNPIVQSNYLTCSAASRRNISTPNLRFILGDMPPSVWRRCISLTPSKINPAPWIFFPRSRAMLPSLARSYMPFRMSNWAPVMLDRSQRPGIRPTFGTFTFWGWILSEAKGSALLRSIKSSPIHCPCLSEMALILNPGVHRKTCFDALSEKRSHRSCRPL